MAMNTIDKMYLATSFGIIPNQDGRYLVPSAEADSLDFLDGDEDIEELEDLEEFDLGDLEVSPCDTLLVTCRKKFPNGKAIVNIDNLRNKTLGTAKDYFLTDDSRYYFALKIAKEFAKKEIRAVKIKIYLIYTEEEVREYVEMLENV